MKIIFLLFAIIIFTSCTEKRSVYKIAFYNVENFFDTINGENIEEEFLPEAKLKWNTNKYQEKIKHLNTVIHSLNYPVILGLCEVENKRVLSDLIKAQSKTSSSPSYGIVHHESPDKRGIDAAFIYDKNIVRLLESGKLEVILDNSRSKPTRDIVWAKFLLKKDTIICLVNHWPSRRGGTKESEHKRIKAANTAKLFIDSILKENANSKIILMGDLNDYPSNNAPQIIQDIPMYPMIFKTSGSYGGTHCYRNHWGVLDHIMVSEALKNNGAIPFSGKINEFDYLFTEYKEHIVPFRTFGGGKYLGGYSDHLPVSIEIELK